MSARAAGDHGGESTLEIEGARAEARAQRRGEEAGPRRGTDEREKAADRLERARRRPLPITTST